MTTQYAITDNTNGKKVVADKFTVCSTLRGWYDAPDAESEQAVEQAIENIEDWMFGRLNEPMWGADFLCLSVEQLDD